MHNQYEAKFALLDVFVSGNMVSINATPHSTIIEKLIVADFVTIFPASSVTQIAIPFSQ
jgi:hypothetical protein